MTKNTDVVTKYIDKSTNLAESSSIKICGEKDDAFCYGYIISRFASILRDLNLSEEQIDLLKEEILWAEGRLKNKVL